MTAVSEAVACSSCSAPLPNGAAFCGVCGGHVEGSVLETASLEATAVRPDSSEPYPDLANVMLRPSASTRAIAVAVDLAAVVFVATLIAAAAVVTGIVGLATVVAPVAAVCLTVWNCTLAALTGSSLGRLAMGLRVVSAEPCPRAPGLAREAARALLFGTLGGLGGLSTAVSPERRGWHETASGTQVIDVLNGADPLGARAATPILRRRNHGLRAVVSPVPVAPATVAAPDVNTTERLADGAADPSSVPDADDSISLVKSVRVAKPVVVACD